MEDKHLGTGQYEPEKYWDARARKAAEKIYEAVCVYNVSDQDNAAQERVQLSTMRSLLRCQDLGGKNMLEYGCGMGRLAGWFAARGLTYSGVDISSGMLEAAALRNPQCSFKKVEEGIPHAAEAFDFVCTVTVLHHNPHEKQAEIIDELFRVLKPGGLMMLYEDIRSAESFNMFCRSLEGWVAETCRGDRAELLDFRHARTFVVREALGKTLSLVGLRGLVSAQNRGLLSSATGRLGYWFDPLLSRLLPARYANSVALLFRKNPSSGQPPA